MSIHSFEEHGLAIDQDLCIAHLHFAKTNPEGGCLGRSTAGLWRNDQPIEVRLFGTPLFGLLEGDRLLGKPFLNATKCLCYRLICSIIERELYPIHATRRLHPNVQQSVRVVICQIGGDFDIGHALLFAHIEVAVTPDTGKSPEVLIFEIGAIRPAIDLHGKEACFARTYIARDVELGLEFAIFAVTHLAAVDPESQVRGGRADVQEDLLTLPLCGDGDFAAIGSDMIFGCRDIGRVVVEKFAPRIANIDIDRIAKSVQLPQTRHRHGAPRRIVVVGLVEPFGPIGRGLCAVELPHATD